MTSSSGFITVYMNNYCLWFYTNANQREQREQTSSKLVALLINPSAHKSRTGVCLNKSPKTAKLYCSFDKKRNQHSQQNPIHSVVWSGALPSINQALTDKRKLWRTISAVIATRRNKSYIRAVQKDTYLISATAKIGLMLDWSPVAFDSTWQQHFQMQRRWAEETALINRNCRGKGQENESET